jgi:uncharacterized protein YfkK (UPF0435 family)
MGNFFTKKYNNNDLIDLQKRLEKIERLDLNNDGVISKDEFEQWKNNDLQDLKNSIKNEVKNDYEHKLIQLNDTISNLNKQLDISKNAYNELENTLNEKNKLIERLGANIKTDDDVKELVRLLSQEQINRYVEELLADPETNIGILPDGIERPLYRNIFKLMLKIMNKVMGSISFELIGHKLNMNLIPKSNEN